MMQFASELVEDLKYIGAFKDLDESSLVEEYKTDSSVRNDLILTLCFPAYNEAKRFRSRHNAEDILGEALFALVECVERWPSIREDDDLRRYAAFSIRRRMKDCIDSDRAMLAPPRRLREGAAMTVVWNISSGDEERTREVPVDCSHDVHDFILDEVDKNIASMRISGASVAEVAKELGRSKKFVYRRLKNLEQAFASIGEEIPEISGTN